MYREWHSNGQLKSELNYENDNPEGYLKEWDENGELLTEMYIDSWDLLSEHNIKNFNT